MAEWLVRLRQLAGWSALVVVTIACLWPKPPHLPGDSDKLVHLGAWLVVSVLLLANRRGLIVSALALMAVSALIEILQPLVNRHYDTADLFADVMGVVLGAIVGPLISLGRAEARD